MARSDFPRSCWAFKIKKKNTSLPGLKAAPPRLLHCWLLLDKKPKAWALCQQSRGQAVASPVQQLHEQNASLQRFVEFEAGKSGSPPTPAPWPGQRRQLVEQPISLIWRLSNALRARDVLAPKHAGRICVISDNTGERHPRRMTRRRSGAGGVRSPRGFSLGFLCCWQNPQRQAAHLRDCAREKQNVNCQLTLVEG